MTPEFDAIIGQFEKGKIGRRELVRQMGLALGGLFLTGCATTGARAGAGGEASEAGSIFDATDVNHLAIRAPDVRKARDFYQRALGLTVSSESERSCFLRCGPDFLAIFQGRARMDHFCFTVKDYEAGDAVDRLKRAGLEPTREANRVYFPDLNGLTVQVSGPND